MYCTKQVLSKSLLKEREPAGAPHLQQWQEQLVEPPPLHEADRSLARAAHLVQQHQHRDLIRRHPVFDAKHVGVHHPIGHHGVEVEALVDAGHGAPRLNPGTQRPLMLKFRRREHHDSPYVSARRHRFPGNGLRAHGVPSANQKSRSEHMGWLQPIRMSRSAVAWRRGRQRRCT